MTPEEWRRVKEILDAALERPESARPDCVAAACGGDAALRANVESLVRAADGDAGLLDATNAVAGGVEVPEPPTRAGERVGAYELVGEIARGGMGVVYLARRADDEFQKNVAIKLMRSGLFSELDVRRFRSERQIVAALDHPNIARLLDGGTGAAGEPYFVMEYVEGRPLLEHCRANGVTLPQRLGLFREICATVQYAHQHLVVHRDLKPGNILVTADGSVRLLDFGIAKLLSQADGAEAGEPTATLERMLTPEYASPEQVRGQPVTTASDVYSLGVILYELIADEKPYRIETGDPADLLRLVCEQDPDRPSTRAAGISSDLDAIVLKAMRKEPERRYASAAALSEDVGRYLDGRPVEARRGSTAYRARKFVRRHRVGAAATALVLVALAGGILATLAEARRARAAEARAERRFNDVRRLANSFLFEFHDAIRDLPGATAARALVVRRALEYLDSLAAESSGDRALRRELAEAYRRVGDVQGNAYTANLGDVDGAAASYRKSIRLLEPAVSSPGATDAERSTLATTYLVDSGLSLVRGKTPEALAEAKRGLALRERLSAESPTPERQMDLAQAWQYVAFDATAAGKNVEAREALASQAAILEEQRRARPDDRVVRRSLAQNLYLTGDASSNAQDLAGALERYRSAAGMQEALLREDASSVTFHRDLAYSYMAIGNTEEALADFGAALDAHRQALATFEAMAAADRKSTDAALGVAMSHHNCGSVLARLARPSEALQEYRRARAAYEPVVAASPSGAWAAGMLGSLYVQIAELERSEDGEEACALYAGAVRLFEPIAAAGGLTPKRRGQLAVAKERLAACANR
ncbi:MAG TPA: protein kinase [Thermoanaerobaculia bacterium]|nr:protein kinase [Thermoanaerobaculia bacterium]